MKIEQRAWTDLLPGSAWRRGFEQRRKTRLLRLRVSSLVALASPLGRRQLPQYASSSLN